VATILLTGSHGLIGRHVSTLLTSAGHRVVPFDIAADPRQDIRDPAALAQAVAGVDAIIHLASAMGVEFCHAHPEYVEHVILGGTSNLLHAAAAAGVRQVVYASSSEVYGNSPDPLLHEEAVKRPISTYGRCKLAAEARCQEFAAATGATVTMLRYCNVYGPGQRTEFVVARFLHQALAGEPLTIYGDGQQVRCYTHVADAAAATVAALERQGGAVAINVAHPEPWTVAQLAAAVAEMVPGVQTVHIPFGQGIRTAAQEVFRRIPVADKAERLLGWRARISLREGLRLTLGALQGVGR
jgi:UDP-glucose 4-epimerase